MQSSGDELEHKILVNQNLKKTVWKIHSVLKPVLRDQFYFFKCVSVKFCLTALYKLETIPSINIDTENWENVTTGVTNSNATL